MGGDGKDNVRVVVRCRPLFGKELAEQRQRIVEMDVPRGQVTLTNPKSPGEDARKRAPRGRRPTDLVGLFQATRSNYFHLRRLEGMLPERKRSGSMPHFLNTQYRFKIIPYHCILTSMNRTMG